MFFISPAIPKGKGKRIKYLLTNSENSFSPYILPKSWGFIHKGLWSHPSNRALKPSRQPSTWASLQPQPHSSDGRGRAAVQRSPAHLSHCCCTAGSPGAASIWLFQADALPLPHDLMQGKTCHWSPISVSNFSRAAGLSPWEQQSHPEIFRPSPCPKSVAECNFLISLVC